MELRVDDIGGVRVLTVDMPALDASNSEAFRGAARRWVNGNRRLVVDMAAVQFIDSMGLGALLGCVREVRRHGGEVKFANVSSAVRALFELVRLQRVVQLYLSREEAIAAFQP